MKRSNKQTSDGDGAIIESYHSFAPRWPTIPLATYGLPKALPEGLPRPSKHNSGQRVARRFEYRSTGATGSKLKHSPSLEDRYPSIAQRASSCCSANDNDNDDGDANDNDNTSGHEELERSCSKADFGAANRTQNRQVHQGPCSSGGQNSQQRSRARGTCEATTTRLALARESESLARLVVGGASAAAA